ncbi:MAG: hypothetical protein CVU34_03535 [Betaproteobacteria bacterium HGW-Betaproteobacteria-7]|jgi:hypothetical protein|nr:MAG: hypothetical protein CVU34_03535 [Betaproteobacteria bacterium HGW-Betaproteobacteria-7]
MSDTFLPTFRELADGGNYLSRLVLANPPVAEQQLIRFLDALLTDPPTPAVFLGLLEQARAPLCFIEEEMARRYHSKAVPLAEEEEGNFRQVIAAWSKAAKAYALCARLEEPDAGNPEYRLMMATILHRCLYYTGMILLEHFRARRELPVGIWLELHGYYESAEEWGIAYLPVQDTLENSLQASHCAAAYSTLMLIDIASPYSNSVRNLNLIRRWAANWAPLISIHRLDDDLEVPPYVVELMKDAPLHPSAVSDQLGNDARRFDTTRLGFQINHMLAQLRQRITPSQLGLGEETTSHVLQLLEHLQRPWTQQASPRRFRRFASEGTAHVACGFEAMHFAVSQKEFVQPDAVSTYSRGEFEELFTFREQVSPGQKLNIRPNIEFPIDEWAVINHSANGFRLGRSSAGQKITHAQLLAICPHDGESFLIAQVTWLMQEHGGGLIAGLATLPGMPVAVAVRHLSTNGVHERYQRAFMLPALPAIGEEASLVLPAGMYQASRVLEIVCQEECWQVRMAHVLQRGTDFERLSYSPL